jgi:hypothetical protein
MGGSHSTNDLPESRVIDFVNTETCLWRNVNGKKGTSANYVPDRAGCNVDMVSFCRTVKSGKKGRNTKRTETDLSFRCMTIQATLSGPISPPFPIFG